MFEVKLKDGTKIKTEEKQSANEVKIFNNFITFDDELTVPVEMIVYYRKIKE